MVDNYFFQEANIIFVDSPVGTGFSYARNQFASQSGDFKQIRQLDQFLRKVVNVKMACDEIYICAYISSDPGRNMFLLFLNPLCSF